MRYHILIVKYFNFIQIKNSNEEELDFDYDYLICKTSNISKSKRLILQKVKKTQDENPFGKFYIMKRKKGDLKFRKKIEFHETSISFVNEKKFNDFYKYIRINYKILTVDDSFFNLNNKTIPSFQKYNFNEIKSILFSALFGWNPWGGPPHWGGGGTIYPHHLKGWNADLRDLMPDNSSNKVYDYDFKRDNARNIPSSNYLYILGPENLKDGVNNFKIGIADDLSKRIYQYKTHSPYPVKIYYSQSCYGKIASHIEKKIKSTFAPLILYQEWLLMNLHDLRKIILELMEDIGQPLYQVYRYGPNSTNFYIDIHEADENKEYIFNTFVSYEITKKNNSIFLDKVSNHSLKGKIETIKIFKTYKECFRYFYYEICKVNEKLHRMDIGNINPFK